MRFRIPMSALALPLGTVLALSLAFTSAPSMEALSDRGLSTARPVLTQEQVQQRYERMRLRIGELRNRGVASDVVEGVLAKEFNIVTMPGRSTVGMTLASVGSTDVVLDKPSMMYDRDLRHYVMTARYYWNNNCSGAPCWLRDGSNGNLGGVDGFAIKIYPRPIFRRDQGISTFNNCGAPTGGAFQPAAPGSNYGVSIELQDTISGGASSCRGTYKRMNMDSAVISEVFDFQNPNCGGVAMNVESMLAHSWSTTSLNSIGISAGKDSLGFSVSWDNAGHNWQVLPRYAWNGYC